MTIDEQRDWWRDAVIYQIYPRSFADCDGDGDGDLNGRHRPSRLSERPRRGRRLALPVLPLAAGRRRVRRGRLLRRRPPIRRDGRVDRLVAEAHARGIRVIVDIVPNHTSERHRWFQEAIAAAPGSPERDRYVFRRGRGDHGELPPTNWLSNFGGSAWEPCGDGWYYLHLFAKEQPDLNWDNPEVREEFLRVLRFWCDKGVDGFRIDVSHGLAKDLRDPLRDRPDPNVMGPQAADGSDPIWDRDEVHTIYRAWRELFNEYVPAKYAIGESLAAVHPRASSSTRGRTSWVPSSISRWRRRSGTATITGRSSNAPSTAPARRPPRPPGCSATTMCRASPPGSGCRPVRTWRRG